MRCLPAGRRRSLKSAPCHASSLDILTHNGKSVACGAADGFNHVRAPSRATRSRPAPFHGARVIRSRVENRRSSFSLPVAVDRAFAPSRLSPVWLGSISCSRSSNRTCRFPASGSRKRFTHSPTEGSRYDVATAPNRTPIADTLPENGRNPVAARGVYRIATDAASGGHVDRPHCRLC